MSFSDPLTINHVSRITVAKENDPVSLKCKTISVPQAEKVTWYFEGEELSKNNFLLLLIPFKRTILIFAHFAAIFSSRKGL